SVYASFLVYLLHFFLASLNIDTYPLSLHDALPICRHAVERRRARVGRAPHPRCRPGEGRDPKPRLLVISRRCGLSAPHSHVLWRSEEHTSELQSRENLVCRLLLEKKKRSFSSRRGI